MNVKIIPYETIHALEILERNVREQDVHLMAYPDWEESINKWKTDGPGYTLIIDGEIIGCAGIILSEWNKGVAWTLLSSLFYKYKKTAYKAVKKNFKKIIEDKNLRRVEALVKVGFDQGCHMLRHLGFNNETPDGMKSFGPNGEDMYLFSRVN